MKSMVQNPKNWRLLSAFVGLLLVLALVFVACGSTQTSSSTPTPAPSTPGTTVYTYKGHSARVSEVAWSPDGKYIASGAEQNIQVWEAMTGKRIQSINLLLNLGPGYGGMSFAWSPDSKYIVAGFADNTAKVVDVMTGKFRLTYTGHSGSVNQVAWSHDGKYIASSSDDKTIQVWDAATGKLLLTNRGYPNPMGNPIWSPDSKYIASSDDKTIQVWDAMTGKLRLTYRGHSEGAAPLAWSPDGKYIVSASWDGTNQVWDAMTGKRIHTFQGVSGAVAWSPDGKYIALGSIFKQGEPADDSNAYVLDATTWSTRLTYTGHLKSFVKDNVLYPQNVSSIAWSPDGKYIASGSDDKTVQVWIAP